LILALENKSKNELSISSEKPIATNFSNLETKIINDNKKDASDRLNTLNTKTYTITENNEEENSITKESKKCNFCQNLSIGKLNLK